MNEIQSGNSISRQKPSYLKNKVSNLPQAPLDQTARAAYEKKSAQKVAASDMEAKLRTKREENYCLMACIPCFLGGYAYSVGECKQLCETYATLPGGCTAEFIL